ncbi:MAG: peptidylprolyl isomerase [Bacteroidota bacterium]
MNKINIFFAVASLFIMSCGPMAKFTYPTEEATAPAVIQFENESEKAETYEWNFGDGDTSMTATPTHRYMASGNYKVELKAKKGNKTSTTTKNVVIKAPEICLVQLKTPFGNILMELYDSTPKHRDNFIKLAEEGFYDSLLFHRVMENFMIQGGDPTSKNAIAGKPIGTGGPGYQIDAEISQDHTHVRGALAAARMPDNVNPKKKSSGSQFYIVHGREVKENMLTTVEKRNGIKYTEEQKKAYFEEGGYPFLDGDYTVFGRVIEGMDVVDQIVKVEKDGRNRPTTDIEMEIVVIK